MIIRATFNDNDYTSILEKYFTRFRFQNYNYYYNKCTDTREYVRKSIESEDLLKKIIYKTSDMTKQDLDTFNNIISTSIKKYIELNYSDSYEYLSDKLQVAIIDNCTDEDENGEIVYYFINKDKYIIA